MANNKPKKKKRKIKKSIRIAQKFAIVRKDSVQRDTVRKDTVKSDTLPRMQAQMPRTNGVVLKVKMKKK